MPRGLAFGPSCDGSEAAHEHLARDERLGERLAHDARAVPHRERDLLCVAVGDKRGSRDVPCGV